jgi:fatty-acid peroxygenase
MRTVHGDQTIPLLREGYALLPNRRLEVDGADFRTRLLGRPVVCVCGEDAARRFYDEELFVRHGALPGPVQRTLTGLGAVHSLDGSVHRHRKGLFLMLKEPPTVRAVVEQTMHEWEAAARRWARAGRVVVFDESADVLLRGVSAWSGVTLDGAHTHRWGDDMVAMVDGFATPGRRHWRARLARRRAEGRLEALVHDTRSGRRSVPAGSMFEHALQHRGHDDEPLGARQVAVEMLNVLRPTVAIAWFVAYAAHALHRWPQHRRRLQQDDEVFAEAFAHEVRRFYPFAPFMGALARRDVPWNGDTIEAGTLVLLDLFGQNHDAALWTQPYTFRPDRFVDRRPGRFELVPQGAGDAAAGHRCPGEDIVVEMLKALVPRLARMSYDVGEQDLTIPLSRIPTRPRSGVLLTKVRGAS